MSNYSRGLTILDITDAANPSAVGRLDTYPASDGTIFNGMWGAYPYFWSGNVAMSDIDSGFYMAADQTRNVAEGMLQFAGPSFAATEGGQVQLVVERAGSASGAVSVGYEILHATAGPSDYSSAGGSLNWPDGDNTTRNIVIDVTNDGVGESMERLLVRLVNPTNGATLGNTNTASAFLSDPGAASEVGFMQGSVTVAERGFGMVIAIVQRTGSGTGAASVDYSMTGGTATPGDDFTGTTSGTISWADGDAEPKFLEFELDDDNVAEGSENLTLSLSNAIGATVAGSDQYVVTIQDADGINVAPNAIAGVAQTRVSGSTVTLDGNQSSDADNDILNYQWSQTGGQGVTLVNANSVVATFTAPTVASDVMLQFELTVSDPGGLSDKANTTVTITKPADPPPPPQPPAPRSSGGATGLIGLFLLCLAVARRRFSQMDVV
jgi:hypothetical protein